jgi:hypothetical protein
MIPHYNGDQIKAMRWVKYVAYMWEIKNSYTYKFLVGKIWRGEKSQNLENLEDEKN